MAGCLLLAPSLAPTAPVASVASAPRSAAKPNIIYILADDLGYGDLGVYGQKQILTPRLDRMAGEGMRFTDHYSGSTVCAPSRSVLMTGLHTGHAHVRANQVVPGGQSFLPADALTVAEILKQAGYATGCIGKWGLGLPQTTGGALKQGFDFFYGYYDQTHAHSHYTDSLYRNTTRLTLDGTIHSQTLFNQEAMAFIEGHKEKPFFLYLAYTLPHAKLQVPSLGPYADKPWSENDKKVAAMITYLDSAVGLVLGKLKALGLDSNTLVMFGSDNGPHAEGGRDPAFFASSGGLRGIKRDGFEGGIRVPFIARWPGKIAPGAVTGHISYFPDLFPTACELAGISPPTGIDGLSFLPTLLGETARQRVHDYLYWEFYGDGRSWQAVRKGDWKALQEKTDFRLFNLKTDIGEATDLEASNPALVTEMKAIFKSAHADTSPLIRMPTVALAGKSGRAGRAGWGSRAGGAAERILLENGTEDYDALGKILAPPADRR